jgi:hypothetical protein
VDVSSCIALKLEINEIAEQRYQNHSGCVVPGLKSERLGLP